MGSGSSKTCSCCYGAICRCCRRAPAAPECVSCTNRGFESPDETAGNQREGERENVSQGANGTIIYKPMHVIIQGDQLPVSGGNGVSTAIKWTEPRESETAEELKRKLDTINKTFEDFGAQILEKVENALGQSNIDPRPPNTPKQGSGVSEEEEKHLKEQYSSTMLKMQKLEEKVTTLQTRLREERRQLEDLNKEHEQKAKEKVMTFALALESRVASFASDLQKEQLEEFVDSLKRDFNIRLLGYDCGLTFLMEASRDQLPRLIERRIELENRFRNTMIPEEQRGTINFKPIAQVPGDIDLRVGEPLPPAVVSAIQGEQASDNQPGISNEQRQSDDSKRRDKTSHSDQTNTGDSHSGSDHTEKGDRHSGSDEMDQGHRHSGSDQTEKGDRNSGSEETDKEDKHSGDDETEKGDRHSGNEETDKEDKHSGDDETEKGDRHSGNEETDKEDKHSGDDETEKGDRHSGNEETDKEDKHSGDDETEKGDRHSGRNKAGPLSPSQISWYSAVLMDSGSPRVFKADCGNSIISVATISMLKETSERQLHVDVRPWALALLKDGTILASTSENEKNILLIDVSNLSVIKTIPTSRLYRGVGEYSSERLVVSCCEDGDGKASVDVITWEGKVEMTMATSKELTGLSQPHYLYVHDDHVFISDFSSDCVYRLDRTTGEMTQTMADQELQSPCQVSVDPAGKLYVASWKNGRVLKKNTADGMPQRLLVWERDAESGYEHCRCVSVTDTNLLVSWDRSTGSPMNSVLKAYHIQRLGNNVKWIPDYHFNIIHSKKPHV